MDNSMVYGEFMNLDKPLYMLWNLSRTFANFAIWGVLLWKIFNYIFKDRGGNAPDILKKIITKGVLIIIGINVSWFALGALLDLSTIATYALGAMPLGAIKEVNKGKDMPILAISTFFDFQSKSSRVAGGVQKIVDPYIYYKRWDINIPQCEKLYHSIVLGPKNYPILPNKPDVSFTGWTWGRQYCVINTQTLADITDLENWKDTNFTAPFYSSGRNDNNTRNELMTQVIQKLESSTNCSADLTGLTLNSNKTGTIAWSNLPALSTALQFGDGGKTSATFCGGTGATNPITITRNAYNETGWIQDFLTGWTPYSAQSSQTFQTLMDQSQGMVGPFVTLYMTLLNFSNLSNTDTHNASVSNQIWWFVEFGLKAAMSIAVFIPLVAIAMTLIIRVVLLWGIIAFIPLGIAFYGLKDELPKKVEWGMKAPKRLWWKSIDEKSIIWLIFAPVLPVFVLSISIIILQTLQGELSKAITADNPTRQFLGIQAKPKENDPSTSCINFWGMVDTCIKTDSETDVGSGFSNLIPRLFINLFGIGLMWSMMKVSLASSSLTAGVGWSIMKFWQQALWAIKIPGLGVWTNAIEKITKHGVIGDTIAERFWFNNDTIQKEVDMLLGNKFGDDKSTDWSTKNTTTPLTIKNTKAVEDAVKKEFISTTANPKTPPNVNTFAKVLETNDKEAHKQFSDMSQQNKAVEVLNYINKLDNATQESINKKELIKDVLEKDIDDILNEKDTAKKAQLMKQLKETMVDNKLDTQNNISKAFTWQEEHQKIINDLFSDIRTTDWKPKTNPPS